MEAVSRMVSRLNAGEILEAVRGRLSEVTFDDARLAGRIVAALACVAALVLALLYAAVAALNIALMPAVFIQQDVEGSRIVIAYACVAAVWSCAAGVCGVSAVRLRRLRWCAGAAAACVLLISAHIAYACTHGFGIVSTGLGFDVLSPLNAAATATAVVLLLCQALELVPAARERVVALTAARAAAGEEASEASAEEAAEAAEASAAEAAQVEEGAEVEDTAEDAEPAATEAAPEEGPAGEAGDEAPAEGPAEEPGQPEEPAEPAAEPEGQPTEDPDQPEDAPGGPEA